jgi:hypothetical protein
MHSRNDGTTWEPLQLNLPAVPVHDLVVKDRSLVVGTHGRSIWILDDLTPIREMAPAIAAKALHVFPVADTVAWRFAQTPRRAGNGQNPPLGALIHYWLKDAPKDDVVLEITDAKGTLVRRLTSAAPSATGIDDDPETDKKRKPALTKVAGMNQAVWDLQWTGATLIKSAKIDMGDAEPGPLALPGTYTLKVTAGGESATAALVVSQDPRLQVSAADLEAQHVLAQKVIADITRLSGIVEGIRSIKQQLAGRKTVLSGLSEAKSVVESADALVAKLDEVEGRLHNPAAEVTYDILAMKGGAKLYSRMVPFFNVVTAGDGAPTQGQREVYEAMSAELAGLEKEYRALIDKDLAALNADAAKLTVGFVTVR